MPPLVLTDTPDAPANFLEEWPEDSRFYRATEHALPGFSLGYLVAWREGKREAVVPYFITDFKLNTMLDDGWLKRLLGGAGLRMACVGHPTAAFGRIDGLISKELLRAIYAALRRKAPLVAYKGFGAGLRPPGFVKVEGLPVAVKRLNGDFWSDVRPHKKRNDLMRKVRASTALRFEEHEGLPAQNRDDVYRLYLNVYRRANYRFERLTPEYFAATAAQSIYVLTLLNGRLVAFTQLLPKGRRIVGKYMGMDYTVSREHKIYFMQYLKAFEICARRGFDEIEFGEASYPFKQALGCELLATWLYYRHRNPLMHALLARLAFLLKPDKGTPSASRHTELQQY